MAKLYRKLRCYFGHHKWRYIFVCQYQFITSGYRCKDCGFEEYDDPIVKLIYEAITGL